MCMHVFMHACMQHARVYVCIYIYICKYVYACALYVM